MSNIIKSFKDLPENIVLQLYKDPILFSRFVFDSWLWSKQRIIARALYKYRRVAVYSATGTGKSFLCANLVPAFLQTREDSIVIIVGANFRSTLKSLWKPCISLYSKARFKLMGEPNATEWQITKGAHYASVCSMRKTEALQGLHAPHMLFIMEEACFDDKTEILTNNGWKSIDTFDINKDKVYTLDINTMKTCYKYASHVHKYDYSGDLYVYDKHGCSFAFSPNHRCLIRENNNLCFKKIKDIKDEFVYFISENNKLIQISLIDVVKVNYIGIIWDVTVPGTHTVYARRNGYCYWTGNSGIEEMAFDAVDGNLTGGNGHVLMIGNPLRPSGRFYETLYDPTYFKVHISIFDTPLFSGEIDEIPEPYKTKLRHLLPNEEYVINAEKKYGKNSPFWKAKVLGIFPQEDEYSLFNVEDIEYSFKNEDVERDGDKILTVDVARFGGDESAFCSWRGFYMDELVTMKKSDLMSVVGQIVNVDKENEYDWIVVDETGLGTGVVDRLNEMGYGNVIGINFSENAFDSETYSNVGTEMFFNLADALKKRKVRLVGSDKLKKQLMALSYLFDSRGRFRLIDMQTLKKQILKESPDRAVACALRFSVIQPRIGIR